MNTGRIGVAAWSKKARDQQRIGRQAVHIHDIYELAAPVLGTINMASAIEFMRGVFELVRTVVEENGTTMLP